MTDKIDICGLVWVTGLSGAGKTTFANALKNCIRADLGCNPVILDGDALREVWGREAAHTPADRHALAKQYAALCALLVSQGHCVICSTISMFQDVRDGNRATNAHYCEVFIDVDDDVRHSRRNIGSLTREDITHTESAFQLPRNPDLVLSNPAPDDIKAGCDKVVSFIKRKWMAV